MAYSSDSHNAADIVPETIVILREDEISYIREFPTRCDKCQHLHLFHRITDNLGDGCKLRQCHIPFCHCVEVM